MTMTAQIQTASVPTALAASRMERLPQGRKQPQDTAAGCFDRAADDRVRATGMETAIGRAKLEHSAATWTERAELLDRLEKSFAARMAAGAAA